MAEAMTLGGAEPAVAPGFTPLSASRHAALHFSGSTGPDRIWRAVPLGLSETAAALAAGELVFERRAAVFQPVFLSGRSPGWQPAVCRFFPFLPEPGPRDRLQIRICASDPRLAPVAGEGARGLFTAEGAESAFLTELRAAMTPVVQDLAAARRLGRLLLHSGLVAPDPQRPGFWHVEEDRLTVRLRAAEHAPLGVLARPGVLPLIFAHLASTGRWPSVPGMQAAGEDPALQLDALLPALRAARPAAPPPAAVSGRVQPFLAALCRETDDRLF